MTGSDAPAGGGSSDAGVFVYLSKAYAAPTERVKARTKATGSTAACFGFFGGARDGDARSGGVGCCEWSCRASDRGVERAEVRVLGRSERMNIGEDVTLVVFTIYAAPGRSASPEDLSQPGARVRECRWKCPPCKMTPLARGKGRRLMLFEPCVAGQWAMQYHDLHDAHLAKT